MKAQAAAGIAQCEKSVAAAVAYADIVERGLGAALRQMHVVATTPPAGSAVSVPARRAIAFGSHQGLVGRFNEAGAEFVSQSLATGAVGVWAVDDRVHAALQAIGRSPPRATLPVPSMLLPSPIWWPNR